MKKKSMYLLGLDENYTEFYYESFEEFMSSDTDDLNQVILVQEFNNSETQKAYMNVVDATDLLTTPREYTAKQWHDLITSYGEYRFHRKAQLLSQLPSHYRYIRKTYNGDIVVSTSKEMLHLQEPKDYDYLDLFAHLFEDFPIEKWLSIRKVIQDKI